MDQPDNESANGGLSLSDVDERIKQPLSRSKGMLPGSFIALKSAWHVWRVPFHPMAGRLASGLLAMKDLPKKASLISAA